MKLLLVGFAAGVLLTSMVFWVSGGSSSQPTETTVASTPTPGSTTVATAPPLPKTPPTQENKAIPGMPSAPVEQATQTPKTKPNETAVAGAAKAEGETKKYVPPLFSGNVEGFPKLDDKTKKTLESAQQKVAMNQPEAAIEALESALKEDPTNGYYAVELAMMQSDLMKNPRRSEQILADHLRRDPESKMVSAAYADFLSQHGRENEATPYFARAAAGNNAPTEAYAQYGHHLMRMHNPEKATEAYRAAFERTAQDREGKVSRNESTIMVNQELGYRAIDWAHAEKQRGNDAEAQRLENLAAGYLPPDDQQLRVLRNANRPAPPPNKSPSE